MSELWVFGYGSLMWRPDFPHREVRPARLAGAHRALCVYSWVHRGTEAAPGLVLGLDRGGSCRGLAFRVAAEDAPEAIATLRARELVTNVYREASRPVRLEDGGGTVPALTFLVDRRHRQYAGTLPPDRLLTIVADAEGRSGRNRDYVVNTAAHLAKLGIADSMLAWLAARLTAGADAPPAMPPPRRDRASSR